MVKFGSERFGCSRPLPFYVVSNRVVCNFYTYVHVVSKSTLYTPYSVLHTVSVPFQVMEVRRLETEKQRLLASAALADEAAEAAVDAQVRPSRHAPQLRLHCRHGLCANGALPKF